MEYRKLHVTKMRSSLCQTIVRRDQVLHALRALHVNQSVDWWLQSDAARRTAYLIPVWWHFLTYTRPRPVPTRQGRWCAAASASSTCTWSRLISDWSCRGSCSKITCKQEKWTNFYPNARNDPIDGAARNQQNELFPVLQADCWAPNDVITVYRRWLTDHTQHYDNNWHCRRKL